jgi:acyl carrier protein
MMDNFLELIRDTLQRDDALEMNTRLEEITEWDSLSMMAVLALGARNFGKRLNLSEIKKAQTVEDLYVLLTTP